MIALHERLKCCQPISSGGCHVYSHVHWLLACYIQQVEGYADDAIFVHVYGPEPHPTSPDINFDSGMLLPNFWSVRRQSVTYDDRLEQAKKIRSITHPRQVRATCLLRFCTACGSVFDLSIFRRGCTFRHTLPLY